MVLFLIKVKISIKSIDFNQHARFKNVIKKNINID